MSAFRGPVHACTIAVGCSWSGFRVDSRGRRTRFALLTISRNPFRFTRAMRLTDWSIEETSSLHVSASPEPFFLGTHQATGGDQPRPIDCGSDRATIGGGEVESFAGRARAGDGAARRPIHGASSASVAHRARAAGCGDAGKETEIGRSLAGKASFHRRAAHRDRHRIADVIVHAIHAAFPAGIAARAGRRRTSNRVGIA